MAGPITSFDAQVTLVFAGSACPSGAICTFGISKESVEVLPLDLPPLVEAFSNFHEAVATNTCLLQTLELKRGPEDTGPTYIAAVNQYGAGLSTSVPPNTTLLVRKELEDVSGRYAGRMYWPSPPEDKIGQDGKVDAVYLGLVQTALDTLYSTLQTNGYQPMVYGSKDGVPSGREVVRLALQGTAATQRRRMRR